MSKLNIPGFDALLCVISSLRDTAHFTDEEGEVTDQLRDLRDWCALALHAELAIPTGTRVADRGFRFDGDKQQHIPQLVIEFDPAPVNSGHSAKGWKDRDYVAAMLATCDCPARDMPFGQCCKARPSEPPKAEQSEDLHIAYMAGFADGKKARPSEPLKPVEAVGEREQFEAWVSSKGVAMRYEGDGHYGNPTVARWWEAWQAQADLRVQQRLNALSKTPCDAKFEQDCSVCNEIEQIAARSTKGSK